MKTKLRMRVEIKEISAEGTFEGLLSPYGNVDGGGDVVEAGAYTKTLLEGGNKRPLLWQHHSHEPIGGLELEDRKDGLWCKGTLLLEDSVAQKAYLFIKARIVKGLSIGFETVKDEMVAGVRRIKEIKLYEGSIVTFPMNESALITDIKNGTQAKSDFNDTLTSIQLGSAGYQMMSALESALCSLIYSNLERDEKITTADVVIQQFTDAYMTYLPDYLDKLTEDYGDMATWSRPAIEAKMLEKSGRKLSKSSTESISGARDHAKSANDILAALLAEEAEGDGEEAATDTSEGKAAETKSEPVPDHSAIAAFQTLKGALQWNSSTYN